MSETQILAPGTAAPDFTLNSAPDKTTRLSDLRGKPVVLVFYPADWSPVCGDQMALYNEMLRGVRRVRRPGRRHLRRRPVVPRGIRQGSQASLPPAQRLRAQGWRLAARTAPIAAQEGVSERALFVLDADGVIRWSYLSPIGVNPGADGILKALESLPGRNGGERSKSPQPSASEARP